MTSSLGDENGSITSTTVMINMSVSTQTREPRGVPVNMAQMGGENSNIQQSRSSPSTPSQQFHTKEGQQVSPSTGQPTREGSPRSLCSETSYTPSTIRRPFQGCRFETGMAKARRRVPYYLGPEKLDDEPKEASRTLGSQEETKLTAAMQELYSQLVPNEESIARRTRFVQKLESMLQARWPGQQINVSVFGSTGNCLGTSDSDVDICITTDCKELEHVCSIAELLDKNGMERIVCVSSAKVPIVKVWDPELQVACDMNVNNPVALENTRMIRSYTQIDERVRPLAMIIKHWAKKRMLNDAALGGTLSSYTWICMVLNFLQTRDFPILPSLQQKPGLPPNVLNGVNVTFNKALDEYHSFGAQNKSSLGQLLFEFFHFYGHKFDYETNALSVRLGKIIPKSDKAWHLLQENRLCVEEPFNTSRNLANTADDTSMRGIHLELRRAFKLVIDGSLDMCCEQYQAAPEERKATATFIHPTARPIVPQAPAQPTAPIQRGGKNSHRGTRHNNRSSARRASNPGGRNPTYLHDLPFQMTPQELQLQAQHQQHLLHDQLFQQYQYLQLQEQELRMQLYQQSLRQRGLTPGQSVSQNGFATTSNSETSSTHPANAQYRMSMSPTMFQARFNGSSPFLRNATPVTGVMTNPASPSLSNAVPDTRRFTRRTSAINSSPAGSMRAHSQPARSLPFAGTFNKVRPANDVSLDRSEQPLDRRISYPYYPQMIASGYVSQPASVSGSIYEASRQPVEYMGYYVGQSPSLLANTQSVTISPIPSHAGLAIRNEGLSPKQSSRSSRLPSMASSPSGQSTNLEYVSEFVASSDVANGYQTALEQPDSPKPRSGPLIVDGSIYSPQRRRPTVQASLTRNDGGTFSASTSDDPGIDTPSSSDDQYQEYRGTSTAERRGHGDATQVVNGVSNQLESMSIEERTGRTHVDAEDHLEVIDEVKDVPALSASVTSAPLIDLDNSLTSDKSETRLNGTIKKKKSRSEKMPAPSTASPAEMSTPLGTRTNGQDLGSTSPLAPKSSDAGSGWQTQKKKKKIRKTVRSENDALLVNNAGGELLPLDESLRKGG